MKGAHIDNQINLGFSSAIKWWERKRLIYNLITLFAGLLVFFGKGDVPNGMFHYEEFYIVFFWLFGANIFYTCGWGIEALLNYYFKIPYFGNRIRQILFTLGTIFSFFWMFSLARSI